MRRLLVLLAVLVALAAPTAASAHPLGNFTVNRFSGIELSGERIYVHYVLDLAEIPTYQEGERVRARGFSAEIARRLVLREGGRRLLLTTLEHAIRERPGAGGLPTLRYEAVFAAPPSQGGLLDYRDENFADRIGWKEVVVHASGGARILASNAPTHSVSDELRAYPRDLLSAPLDVDAATARFEPGGGPSIPPSLGAGAGPERGRGGFESLIAREDLGAGVILLSLLVAAFWGAAHALSPGHGKAIVAAYLVGARGTPRHALALGLIVTVTHTIGVFALGLVTLSLSEFVVPETLYPWLNLVSAVLVVVVGVTVLRLRLLSWLRPKRPHHHDHHHRHHHRGHSHRHDHGHGHAHVADPGGGVRGLLTVGVSGGLLPCPTALVVLLAAISLHRVGYGLVLIVAFSLGLAATISGIGLIAVTAKRAFNRMSLQGPLVRLLPAVSALVIVALGIAMTVRALPTVV